MTGTVPFHSLLFLSLCRSLLVSQSPRVRNPSSEKCKPRPRAFLSLHVYSDSTGSVRDEGVPNRTQQKVCSLKFGPEINGR